MRRQACARPLTRGIHPGAYRNRLKFPSIAGFRQMLAVAITVDTSARVKKCLAVSWRDTR
jgi:hypothetical protein